MAEKGKEEYIINWLTDLPYKYAIGKLAVKFFEVLKEEKKILGSQCPKCKKVNYPPRAICAKCMVEMTVDDMDLNAVVSDLLRNLQLNASDLDAKNYELVGNTLRAVNQIVFDACK